MIYFSDIFSVDEAVIDSYGAFNISLLNDLPLFVDPFLLYASDKPEYRQLHEEILRYLSFLRDKAAAGEISDAKIARWYKFSEVKQVWFGYSETGNSGSGLGPSFGRAMSAAILDIFPAAERESISESIHLEKLGLFRSGVGRDNISDFTCNLIKGYLLGYTERFACEHLQPSQCRRFSVPKACFDYRLEEWRDKTYTLPCFNDDYVLLTPKDILTKDDNWINIADMRKRYFEIVRSVDNSELRDRINDVYNHSLPRRRPRSDDRSRAVARVVQQYPEFMDYYIRLKESRKDEARQQSGKIVDDAMRFYIGNTTCFISMLSQRGFYDMPESDLFEAARRRIMFMKDVIENQDGYKLLYNNGRPVGKERELQLMFKLTWYATRFDVNAEVNNGRGPVDFKISMGSGDKTLVEFKLAGNPKLRQNLMYQVGVYEKANGTDRSLKVIFYFNEHEHRRVLEILNELNLAGDPNIILIDAGADKPSASNVKM